jgi:hypothetical protein
MKIILIVLLLASTCHAELSVQRTVDVIWGNQPGCTWEYKLYKNTCHAGGIGIQKGTTDKPVVNLGDICSLEYVYIQVRTVKNNLFSKWIGDSINNELP